MWISHYLDWSRKARSKAQTDDAPFAYSIRCPECSDKSQMSQALKRTTVDLGTTPDLRKPQFQETKRPPDDTVLQVNKSFCYFQHSLKLPLLSRGFSLICSLRDCGSNRIYKKSKVMGNKGTW